MDGTARVWNAQNGQPVTQPSRHNDGVDFAQFSSDGKRMATCAMDDTARVWDVQTGLPVTDSLKHAGPVRSVQFSPDGRCVVTASDDHTARVWNAQTGQPLTDTLKHDASVLFAQFSPDGRCVVTASEDQTARVWDVRTGQPLTDPLKHEGPVLSARFSPDGRRMVTVAGVAAQVWDLGFAPSRCPEWLLRLAETLSGKRLNNTGILLPTGLDRAKTIAQLRQDLKNQPDDADWAKWGRWLLADPSTRAISPFSSLTVPQYINDRLNECTLESLDEAAQLTFGNRELSQKVSEERVLLKLATDAQSDAEALGGKSSFVEAEAKYREALQFRRELWKNQPLKWEPIVISLMDVLKREGKYDDAEQLFHDLLTSDLLSQTNSADLLLARAYFFARRGRWKDAAADFSRLLEFSPADLMLHHSLAPLLAQGGDLEGFRQHGARVLALFGGTNDPVVAGRMAEDCLIVPNAGIDLDAVARLADTSVTRGRGHEYLAYFEFAKGLAEYRQGHFASAISWTRKALAIVADCIKAQAAQARNERHSRPATGQDFLQAQAWLVQAMAQSQSMQANDSREALAKGAEIIQTQMPTLESGDIGEYWTDWIIAHELLNEAQALILTNNLSVNNNVAGPVSRVEGTPVLRLTPAAGNEAGSAFMPTPLGGANCYPAPPGLVHWWPGDGDAGDIIGDLNTTIMGNVSYASGEVHDAFSFDGTGGYVYTPTVTAGMLAGTVDLWFNVDNWNWQDAPHGMFFWANTMNLPNQKHKGDGINLGTHAQNTSTGELLFGIFDPTGPQAEVNEWNWAHSGVVPQPNTWYHVAGTWGSNGLAIYVNGVLMGTNAYAGPGPTYDNYNIIGSSSWPESQIDGFIDELHIFNRALSAGEIHAIYAAGPGGICKGLAPTVSWSTPDPINYGTPLSSIQLDASASIPGAFSYTPPAGTILPGGTNTLSVVFHPGNTVDFVVVTNFVSLLVKSNGILGK
jgi:tetratricopeptide (TPR) repeat protein